MMSKRFYCFFDSKAKVVGVFSKSNTIFSMAKLYEFIPTVKCLDTFEGASDYLIYAYNNSLKLRDETEGYIPKDATFHLDVLTLIDSKQFYRNLRKRNKLAKEELQSSLN